ncbi:DUF5812 family protein [Halomontanus rarus]|uniref:DUF5812 family protein n=1 Tax=Halomontanus rarus TaxID=3034020 RepID=UPI001A99B88C
MTEQTGTYVVTHAEDDSAVVRDVETAQVLTLSSNPGLEVHDVLEATVAPDPPLEVSWQVVEVADRRSIDVIDSDLAPTTHSKELAAEADVGDLVTNERAGTGEIHVLSVPTADTEDTARDVIEDVETVARAARLEAVRVEVRRSPEDGVVSVRYLPD